MHNLKSTTASKNIYTLSQGTSANYVKFTLVIVLVLFSLFYFSSDDYVMLAITLLLLILTIFIRGGVQFDLNKRRVREYQDLYIIKLGIWRHLSQYDKFRLKRLKETKTAMGMGFVQNSWSHSSYTVHLTSKSGLDPILISDSKKHEDAQEHLTKISLLTKIESYDHVEKAMESAAKARARGDFRYARGRRR